MNVIVATSRGREMEQYFRFRWNSHLIVRSGGSIWQLAKEADKFLDAHKDNTEPHHVFFVAGLPDLTWKISDRAEHYSEVTFAESPEVAHDRMTSILSAASSFISNRHHAKTSFSTIIPMSLDTWNNKRLNDFATSYLIHHNQYECMQVNLVKATITINKSIIEMNIRNGMPTARIAKPVLRKSGRRRKSYRVHYGKLADGVHVDEETMEEQISILSMAMLEARRPDLFLNGKYDPPATTSTPSPKSPGLEQDDNMDIPPVPSIALDSSIDSEEDTCIQQWRSY